MKKNLSMLIILIPLFAFGQNNYWNTYKKNNIRIVGGINTHIMLTEGRYPYIGSKEIDKKQLKPMFQIGFEFEHMRRKGFAFSFEPLFVFGKYEVIYSSINEAYIDTNDFQITPTETAIVSSDKGTLTFKKQYISIPLFIKYDLGKKKNFVAKIGLSYNLTLVDNTTEKRIQQSFGRTITKKFVNVSPFPDFPYEIFIPYQESQISSREYTPCSDQSFIRSCLDDVIGLSLGIEKRGIINRKLNIEFRLDLYNQTDYRFDDTYTSGYYIAYLNFKYRIN